MKALLKLYEQILADKTTRPGGDRSNLDLVGKDGVYAADNTKTLYETMRTENGNPSYYFAGNALDNWVYFADIYWRIIRINEDNSIRLLYVGPNKNTTSGPYIALSVFNDVSPYNPLYVGYMYGNSNASTLSGARGNQVSSTIKTVIDNWYDENITGKNDGTFVFDKYVSRTAIYCNDRSVSSGTYSPSGIFYFGGYGRYTNHAPSYKCGQSESDGLYETNQALADKFSGSTTGGGNGLLANSPVALITMDELIFIGSVYNNGNGDLWIERNAGGYILTGYNSDVNHVWWSMTPYRNYYSTQETSRGGYVINYSQWISSMYEYRSTVERGVRPVLSLKSCVQFVSGDGSVSSSKDDAYRVSISSSCASALN